jgi:peptide/nickel transport system permease protein
MSTEPTTVAKPATRFQRFWDSDVFFSFRRSPVTIVAAVVTVILVLAALLAPWISPYNPFDPASLNLMDGFTRPNSESMMGNYFLLGSDHQGRDVLSTILYGSRVSLFVGISATLFAMAMGISLGLAAGYLGGSTDAIIMRVADIQLSFPAILIALLIFGVARGIIPPSQQESMAVWVLIVAIGLSNWAQFARTVRGATMVERQKDYVSAARIMGVHPLRILIRFLSSPRSALHWRSSRKPRSPSLALACRQPNHPSER